MCGISLTTRSKSETDVWREGECVCVYVYVGACVCVCVCEGLLSRDGGCRGPGGSVKRGTSQEPSTDVTSGNAS